MIYTEWNLAVTVDNSDVTPYIIGSIEIDAQLETARTLSFKVAKGAGVFEADPIKDIGKKITVDINTVRCFTGVIRNVNINLDSRTVQYNCSDEYNERLDLQAQSFYDSNQNIKYSDHIFGGDRSTLDPLSLYECYLSQLDKQYTLGADGNPLLTSVINIGSIIKTFTENDILIQGSSVSYQNTSGTSYKNDPLSPATDFKKSPQESTEVKTVVGADTKPLNEIVNTVYHRYPVINQVNIQYEFNSTAELTHETRGLLSGATLPSRAMLEAAIAKTGWHLKDLVYEDLPPSQVFDVNGTPVVWTRTADAQTKLFKSATFTLSYRWVTTCQESQIKAVRCTESIAKYGKNSETRQYAIEGMNTFINFDDWKNFKINDPDFTGLGFSKKYIRSEVSIDPINYDIPGLQNRDLMAYSTNYLAAEQAAEIAENIADAEIKREIVGKGGTRGGVNTTSLVFKVPFTALPNFNVGYRAEYDTRFWKATGIISNINLVFSVDGSALADVTLTSITETAQRATDLGNTDPGGAYADQNVTEGGITFNTYNYEPDGQGGYIITSSIDAPQQIAAAGEQATDIEAAAGAEGYIYNVSYQIPTFIRGIDDWGTVGITETTDINLLPMGYYADTTSIADGFTGNNTTPLTGLDLPANIIIIDVPPLPLSQNQHEYINLPTTVKLVPYTKDTIQPGTGI